PMLPAETLKRCGFSIAIYPSAGMGAACAALEAAYGWLLKKGSLEGSPVPAFDMARLHELVGFADVWDFERRHVERQD
ncbi:MAG: carboxyvinyl-carboxyphosphonate phosphorylmutase, partial [Burkholderiales bacterium]